MEPNLPVPGFIADLKYLPAYMDWDGSFRWLAEFVSAKAAKQQDQQKMVALLLTLIGGIWLFGQGGD